MTGHFIITILSLSLSIHLYLSSFETVRIFYYVAAPLHFIASLSSETVREKHDTRSVLTLLFQNACARKLSFP